METPPRPQSRTAAPWTPYTLSRGNTDVSSWRHHKPAKRRRAASDELKLFCMGYKQELTRSFTLFNNAGVALSLLSPLAALTGTYSSWGLLYGGPVMMMWGLPVVSCFSLLVALSLAEMVSAYPTSGAIYYWTWALGPPRLKTVSCWVSGWLLVLGQVAFTAANCRIFTDLLAVFVLMATGNALSSGTQLATFLAVFALSAALASSPNGVMAFASSLAAFWNLVALVALAATLPALARRRQPLSYIYTHWEDSGSATGVHSRSYNLVLGLLLSQYLFLGFDSCAHMAEETRHADVNAPRGMLAATVATALCGYLYLLVLNLVATDPAGLLAAGSESRGSHAVAQLLWNVHKEAYGSGRGGLALLTIPLVAALMCVHMCVAANARMLFAFARDGAVPLHRYVARVGRRSQTPVVAVWVVAALAALLGTPMYFSGPYVATIETMAIVNTYLSYAAPLLFKLLSGRGLFLPGPFYTGLRISRTANGLALAWIVFITTAFSLPTAFPITGENMNYNAAGTGLVVLTSLTAFYCPGIGGRRWFTGPRPNLGQFAETEPVMQGQQGQQQGQGQGQESPRRQSSPPSSSVERTDAQTTAGYLGGGNGPNGRSAGAGGGPSDPPVAAAAPAAAAATATATPAGPPPPPPPTSPPPPAPPPPPPPLPLPPPPPPPPAPPPRLPAMGGAAAGAPAGPGPCPRRHHQHQHQHHQHQQRQHTRR